MQKDFDHYSVLDLKPGATTEELREAYRSLVRVWHPDRFTGDPAFQARAQEKLKQINLAYEFLIALERNKEQTVKARNSEGVQIDRFVYHEGSCEQVASRWDAEDPMQSREPLQMGSDGNLVSFASGERGVRVEFEMASSATNQRLSRILFKERSATIFIRGSVSRKVVVLPLVILFLRDVLHQKRNDTQRNRAMIALRSAGWDGSTLFEGNIYLRAEQRLCSLASDDFIPRFFTRRNWIEETTGWFSDMKAACRGEDLISSAKWLSYSLKENPAATQTWPELLL
jgi:curved DNA-binding protein CbpA